ESCTDPADGLRRLLGSYVEFVAKHSSHVDILVSEEHHLHGEERSYNKQSQREYVGEWVHLMLAVHPEISEAEARVRVHAVLSCANGVARTPRLRGQPALLEPARRFCADVVFLGLEVGAPWRLRLTQGQPSNMVGMTTRAA